MATFTQTRLRDSGPLLKRAWYGSHHHYKVAYTPLYVAEACYKYNNRNNQTIFDKFVNESMMI